MNSSNSLPQLPFYNFKFDPENGVVLINGCDPYHSFNNIIISRRAIRIGSTRAYNPGSLLYNANALLLDAYTIFREAYRSQVDRSLPSYYRVLRTPDHDKKVLSIAEQDMIVKTMDAVITYVLGSWYVLASENYVLPTKPLIFK